MAVKGLLARRERHDNGRPRVGAGRGVGAGGWGGESRSRILSAGSPVPHDHVRVFRWASQF